MGTDDRQSDWWRRLEGAQAAPVGHDAQHWIGVYDELIRALTHMEADAGADDGMRFRVRDRLAQARERRRHWASYDAGAGPEPPVR